MVSHHARASGRQNDVRSRGSNRVSSSRGARSYFGAVFVFVCFVCVIHLWFYFWGTFSHFWVSSVFSVLQKACLTSSLHFFNWFLSTSIFTVGFFWGTSSDFWFSRISCCCKKHVLPLGCMFLDWFLTTILFTMVLSDQANLGFEWCRLWYGVQHLRGGRVRTTSSPPTP